MGNLAYSIEKGVLAGSRLLRLRGAFLGASSGFVDKIAERSIGFVAAMGGFLFR
jgi:hypothetical protein